MYPRAALGWTDEFNTVTQEAGGKCGAPRGWKGGPRDCSKQMWWCSPPPKHGNRVKTAKNKLTRSKLNWKQTCKWDTYDTYSSATGGGEFEGKTACVDQCAINGTYNTWGWKGSVNFTPSSANQREHAHWIIGKGAHTHWVILRQGSTQLSAPYRQTIWWLYFLQARTHTHTRTHTCTT